MNNFQKGTIAKSLASIDQANSNEIYRHKLNEYERRFIQDLGTKPMCYELSKKQNHVLNSIREKL